MFLEYSPRPLDYQPYEFCLCLILIDCSGNRNLLVRARLLHSGEHSGLYGPFYHMTKL